MNQKERIKYLKEVLLKRRKRAQIESYIFFSLSVIVVIVSILIFWLSPTIASKELYDNQEEKLKQLEAREKAAIAELALISKVMEERENEIRQRFINFKPVKREINRIADMLYKEALNYEGFEKKDKSSSDANYDISNYLITSTPYIITGKHKLYFKDEPSAAKFVEKYITEDMINNVHKYKEEFVEYNNKVNNSLESDSTYREQKDKRSILKKEKESLSSQILAIKNPYGFRDVGDLKSVVAFSKMIRDSQSNAFLIHSNITRY